MELKKNDDVKATSRVLGGLTGLFVAPPGTGKSWLLGSIAEVEGIEKVLLLATKPREANSFMYMKHRDVIDVETFRDHKWAPAAGRFEAGAFTRLFNRVLELYDDDMYDAVLVDPFTDVTYLAAHELLMAEEAATPRDLRDSIGFYSALKYKLKDFTQSLVGLAAPEGPRRPKHVLVTVHAQPTKEDTVLPSKQGGGTKESSDHRGQGVEFMGDALPMIEGSYRREIAGEFDIVGFNTVQHRNEIVDRKMQKTSTYVVQLNADPERHAKAAIVPRMAVSEVPNNMTEIFRAIEEATKHG